MNKKWWRRPSVLISIPALIVLVAGVLLVALHSKGVSRPSAPQSISVVAAAASAQVSWSVPTSDGGAAITAYTATSNPGSRTCTTSSTSCTVSGLTNGIAYRFTVVATNSAGTGPHSHPSPSVTPSATAARAPTLRVAPSTNLVGGASVTVSGSGFTPLDQVYLVECLATAAGQGGCDTSTATPASISAAGVLPSTKFTVVTGVIGHRRCGTSPQNLAGCVISASNSSGGDTAAAPIVFRAPRVGTTTTTTHGGTTATTSKHSTTTTATSPTTTTSRRTTTTTSGSKSVALNATYAGGFTVVIINNNSTSGSATVTSLHGSGSGNDAGLSGLTGSGQVPTTSTNSGFSFNGNGTLSGASGSLSLVVTSSSATVPDGAGTATLSGMAKITGGTGQFAGASGTLKFNGSFTLTGIDSGTQAPSFTSTLSGTINL